MAQRQGLVVLLVLHGGELLRCDRLELLLELRDARAVGRRGEGFPRRRLVDEVDRLVGQVPVGDVALGQLHGGGERLVADREVVEALVGGPQPAQDHLRLLQ